MNVMYCKTTVYLDERQKDIINRYMPNKLSSLIRDLIDIIIRKDLIETELFKDDPEMLSLIVEYKKYLEMSQNAMKNRELLRSELYAFLNQNNVPRICANKNGEKIGLKTSRNLIPLFREKGYVISDNLANKLIVDYIHMIHATGADDAAWKEYQLSDYFLEFEALKKEEAKAKKRRSKK